MKKIFYLFILMALVLNIYPNISVAGIDLPWSTTYDCPEWTQSDGSGQSCDNMSLGDGWITSDGSEEQITIAANYTDGGGGRGQRHWQGDDMNNNSYGIRVHFNTPQTEIWIRWYMRYEAGFQWYPYMLMDKIIYVNVGAADHTVIEYYGSDKFNFMSQATNYYCTGCGFDTVMQSGGGATYQIINSKGNLETHYSGDGQWHYFEAHLKQDTDGTDGVGEIWIDGVQKYFNINMDYGNSTFRRFLLGSNQAFASNGRDMYVDFDDLAISNTGYIGPIGGGGEESPPATPTGLTKSQ